MRAKLRLAPAQDAARLVAQLSILETRVRRLVALRDSVSGREIPEAHWPRVLRVSAAWLTETLRSLAGGTVITQIRDGLCRSDAVRRLCDADGATAVRKTDALSSRVSLAIARQSQEAGAAS